MCGAETGIVADPPSGIPRALEEVYVLKPEGVESFVEASELIPGAAANEQAGSWGLFDASGLGGVKIERTPAAIDPVGGPQSIDTENFKGQGCRRGEAPDLEPELGASRLAELAAGSRDLGVGKLDGGQGRRCGDVGVRIEQEDGLGAREGSKPLVDRSGEAEVARIGDQPDAAAPADQVRRAVAGGIVNHQDSLAELGGISVEGV
jgi:hypothetical protein